MTKAIAAFAQILFGSVIIDKWQNYDPTGPYDGHKYVAFTVDGIVYTSSGDQSSLRLQVANTPANREQINQVVSYGWLIEVKLFEFQPPLGPPLTEIASYIGQSVEADVLLDRIEIELGSSLAPIGSQVPPRMATTALIGEPCRV